MYDDYQDLDDATSFLDELEEEDSIPEPAPAPKRPRRNKNARVMGMTPPQLFVISVELACPSFDVLVCRLLPSERVLV